MSLEPDTAYALILRVTSDDAPPVTVPVPLTFRRRAAADALAGAADEEACAYLARGVVGGSESAGKPIRNVRIVPRGVKRILGVPCCPDPFESDLLSDPDRLAKRAGLMLRTVATPTAAVAFAVAHKARVLDEAGDPWRPTVWHEPVLDTDEPAPDDGWTAVHRLADPRILGGNPVLLESPFRVAKPTLAVELFIGLDPHGLYTREGRKVIGSLAVVHVRGPRHFEGAEVPPPPDAPSWVQRWRTCISALTSRYAAEQTVLDGFASAHANFEARRAAAGNGE